MTIPVRSDAGAVKFTLSKAAKALGLKAARLHPLLKLQQLQKTVNLAEDRRIHKPGAI